METKAKSVDLGELMAIGEGVAKQIEARSMTTFKGARLAYFPDFGIAGGEVVLDKVAGLNIGEAFKMSSELAEAVLSPRLAVQPALKVIDNILIFGGKINPDIVFELHR